MTIAKSSEPDLKTLPDHTQLPDSDGTFVKNFQEHPQSLVLTDSLQPVLEQLHPDQHYAIGQDCGIYWRITDPPERGPNVQIGFMFPMSRRLLRDRCVVLMSCGKSGFPP